MGEKFSELQTFSSDWSSHNGIMNGAHVSNFFSYVPQQCIDSLDLSNVTTAQCQSETESLFTKENLVQHLHM